MCRSSLDIAGIRDFSDRGHIGGIQPIELTLPAPPEAATVRHTPDEATEARRPGHARRVGCPVVVPDGSVGDGLGSKFQRDVYHRSADGPRGEAKNGLGDQPVQFGDSRYDADQIGDDIGEYRVGRTE
ncbi:hypothetical protein NE236_10115 [Actinoallomurus purpureus]|nr:hypothetical protein [Actinoallomurus purpureus]